MRILVTGVSGQLGYDVERELERRGIEHLGTSSRELDITDREAVERLMEAYRPDAAIHCAAYTKVDLAEDEPERCWAVNADGTRNMAAACRKTGASCCISPRTMCSRERVSDPMRRATRPDR